MRTQRGRATISVVATLAAVACLLAGCSGSEEEARAAADRLATGVASGDLSGVTFTDRPADEVQHLLAEVTEGMGDVAPEVRVTRMEPGDQVATATLSYEWPLGSGGGWSYDTRVRLLERDDAWAVRWTPGALAPGLRDGERFVASSVPPARADILGEGGRPLVTARPVVRFGIDKTQVEGGQRQRTSALALAELLGVDLDTFAAGVASAGERAFVEAIVLRRDDVPARVRAAYPDIPGAIGVADELPLAPTREFARPLLGVVGPVTAELVEQSGGRLGPGDETGLSGLQRRYDAKLSGTPGVVVQRRSDDDADERGRVVFQRPPVNGTPLRTTLDAALQVSAEHLLADVRPASALVAIRPSTGDVVAAASGPGGDGYSTATLGQYAPGSTFKVVSALALLRAGLDQDTPVRCTPTLTVDGRSFENYDDYPPSQIGTISLRSAFAHSCNTAMMSEREHADQQSLADAAAALGLGVDHDLGFPAYLGAVPSEASGTDHAASMIGQGRVLASPLAMATVAASVVRGGTVVPRLVVDDEPDGPQPAKPLTTEEAADLRALMRAVVTEGSGDFLGSLRGAPVLAKTGTAEFGDQQPLQTHAWMLAAQGDLAVAVFVEVGESGSHTAGPLVADFLAGAS